MTISFDTVLHRVPELSITTDGSNNAKVTCGGHTYPFGCLAISLLDAFHGGRSVADALLSIQRKLGGDDAVREALSTIALMHSCGILVREDAAVPSYSARPYPLGGYDAPGVHIAILSDRQRKSAFLEAVRRVVKPGDVVLDLGTGSGVFAVAAVQAGARHVYAVEPSHFARSAREVFVANGVADRVTLIQGWSNQVTLPERANVMINDIAGNEPLDMQILEATSDALQRLLLPGARLIPNRIRLYAALADAPPEEVEKYAFSPGQIERWRSWYGIDFSPLLEVARRSEVPVYATPDQARQWRHLSEPVLLTEVDLANIDLGKIGRSSTFTAAESASCNAIVAWFEVDLGDGLSFSTNPRTAYGRSHWFTPIWMFTDALQLNEGDRVDVRYAYDGDGRTRLSVGEVTRRLSEVMP